MRAAERRFLTAMTAVLAGLAVATPATAQRDWSSVEFEATHLAGNVYVLISGVGGNIGVSSGPDGSLLVDNQFAPLADKIRAALNDLGQSPVEAEPRFILNTHWHGDHMGGNVEFSDESTIIAHTNVRGRLSTLKDRVDGNITPAERAQWETWTRSVLPVITFDESLSIHFNGEEIRAFHIPHGHTDGDAVVYFTGSGVLHMGDDFPVPGQFPYVDIDSGGSVEGLARGIGEVLQQIPDDTILIPGHGPVSTVEDLAVFHRMLRETIAMVRQKMESGASLERIQSEGVSDEWASWGEGEVFIPTERWLATVFTSLGGGGDGEYVEHGHGRRHQD